MTITVGRIVHFALTEAQAERVNRRTLPQTGNTARAGDVVPLIVTRVWADESGHVSCVNGQALLDGNDSLWVTSAKEGTEPGTWSWPSIRTGNA
jgi:hypothetical protein